MIAVDSSPPLPTAVVGIMLVVATATDLRSRQVPVWLTLGGIGGGVIAALIPGGPGLTACLLGLAAGALPLLPFVAFGGLGAADILLLAAIGTWEGWRFALWTIWWAALAGGGLATLWWVRGQRSLPYVPAIAVGTAIAATVSFVTR